jgi:hypothetical protein
MLIDSLTYTPPGKIGAKDSIAATVSIDGSAKNLTVAAKSAVEGDPVEIWLGSDDLDSLEALRDLVAAMRKGHSLTIAVAAMRYRDTFPLANVGAALGRCQ